MELLNMRTQANHNKRSELQSIINICDILQDDIETGLINKTFEFTINYLMGFNVIKFKDIQLINKYYYMNNFYLLSIKLNDLKKESVYKLRTIYLN